MTPTRPAAWLLAAVLIAARPPAVGADDLDAWAAKVAGLKADDQVAAVRDKLAELNPKFQPTGPAFSAETKDGVVRHVHLDSTYVADIRPLRVLRDLESVSCPADFHHHGPLADLSPLRGMRLKGLNLMSTAVADLAPLKGMPLTGISLQNTKVKDLTPLHDAPLTWVSLPQFLDPKQLEFLKDKELTYLAADHVQADSPTLGRVLAKSRLETLQIVWDDRLTTLDFAKEMPLRTVDLRWCPVVSLDPLAGCDRLESVSLQASKSPRLSLAPLKGKPLTGLTVAECPAVHDLSPLKGMTTLKVVDLRATSVADLGPLAGCENLERAGLGQLRLKSLKPLAGLAKLTFLDLKQTEVVDRNFTPLLKLPLESVRVDVNPKTGKPDPGLARVLKQIKTLKTVNDKPAEEVLK